MSETAPGGKPCFDLDTLDQDDPVAATTELRHAEFRIFQLAEAEEIRTGSDYQMRRALSSEARVNQSISLVAFMGYRAETRMLGHYLRPQDDTQDSRQQVALFLGLEHTAAWHEIEPRYEQWWQYMTVLRIADAAEPPIGIGIARALFNASLQENQPPFPLPVPASLYNAYRALLVDQEHGLDPYKP